jgi:DNA repair exonuclease SbcCD ATPase subunit
VIPRRVRLKGFLCYKDEQTIEFDGNSTLWMLSGLNGSGKSAIFDAVTFALFGHHRGGGQHNVELINKDGDAMSVEFDFLLDGHEYRARRTLKRDTKGGARGTQQMLRLDAGHNGNGKPAPIEDTGQKREFDAWVADNIGLNYDTFTSSVLLLQGKAEKLLDSRPEGRREVLASIVDLERYERLHKKAEEGKRALADKIEDRRSRMNGLPVITPIEIAEAKGRIESAEARRQEARAEVERLRELELHARAWVELDKRLGQSCQRHEQALRLLEDAPAIEQKVTRLRELREVLPRLHEIAVLRGQAHEADQKTKSLTQQREKVAAQCNQRDVALKQARDKRATLQGRIAAGEAEHRELGTRLHKSAVRLEKLRECERQEATRDRLRDELARLPADPGADVARAREAHETLATLGRTVPLLARFRGRREALRQAQDAERSAAEGLRMVEARGKACAAEVKRLEPLAAQATKAQKEAADQAATTRTLLEQARTSLREVTELEGAKVCRHCGQELTPGHLLEEKHRRSAAVATVEAEANQAADSHRAAHDAERMLRGELNDAEKQHQEARLEYRDCKARLGHAQQDIERLRGECSATHAELPEPFRSRAAPQPPADWLTTTYPGDGDLDALRTQARGIDAARRRHVEAEQVQQQWARLKAQESAALESLTRLLGELPADRQAVRSEHTQLELNEKAVFKTLDDNRALLREVETDLDRLGRERERAQAELASLDTQFKEQEVVQHAAQRNIGRTLKQLPPAWQPAGEKIGIKELHTFEREKTDLETEETDARGTELQQARLGLDVLRQEVEALEAEQKRVPAEARQEPTALAGRLAEARAADAAADEQLGEARQQLAMLENTRKQREEVEREITVLEGEYANQELLAKLLGREHLQLYLVRQAERQVVEYANAVLDRLSGGQLYLRLSGLADGEGASGKALDLEAYNRSTGEKPINVAFLSGSQKFRVAVSLALGIGQYASRQHRPIESVIIDEGFGCLDSQGRQVMIQELQNLRSQMRCILLVSHQEDFAESFSDGYHFRLEGGATRVRRFQK